MMQITSFLAIFLLHGNFRFLIRINEILILSTQAAKRVSLLGNALFHE